MEWILYELGRRLEKETGIPVVSFDGDQADPRNFSEAQYDTRIQGLNEVMVAKRRLNKMSNSDKFFNDFKDIIDHPKNI